MNSNLSRDQFSHAGLGFTFTALHREQDTGDFGDRFGQDKEPAGKYVTQSEGQKPPAEYSQEEVTLKRPLVMKFGDDYGTEGNWKSRLSAQHGGKTGEELSSAIRDSGFDGIVTHDKYGPSETVLLDKEHRKARR